ncbi:MAG: DegT/DnrJ/EryC1/StrS family aminotransferase, partial [Clostridia bacterium]
EKIQNERCVFVTSPDYFGNCVDIASLSQFCKNNGFLLAVDSAHGAHFPYSDLLPDSPCQFADISVCSLHKTMASYGGGAVLNVTNSRLVPYAYYYRQVIHSTSPNYLVMASADYSRDLWEKNGEKYYREIKEMRENFVANLPSKFFVEKSDDLSRLVVAGENMDGRKAQEELGKLGVFVEMASGNKLVSILTPFNADKLDFFSQALSKIEICPIDTREREFAPLQLAQAEKIGDKLRFVTIDQAVGKVSANEVGIYPPGIPLARRGDIFDQKTIKIIKDFQSCIFGLVKGFVIVLE